MLVLVVALAPAVGCTRQGAVSSDGPAQPPTRIRTEAGVFETGFAAELRATFGAPPVFQLSLLGQNGDSNWEGLFRLSAEQVAAGHAIVMITTGPLDAALGTIQVSRTDASPSVADSGTAEVTLGKGRVTGSAQVMPEALSGTFEGALIVSCLVPRSMLPEPPPEGGVGSTVLTLDQALVAPDCRPLRAWAK